MAACQEGALLTPGAADECTSRLEWWRTLAAQAAAPTLEAVVAVESKPERTNVQSNCSVRAFALTLRGGARIDAVLKHVNLSRNKCAALRAQHVRPWRLVRG